MFLDTTSISDSTLSSSASQQPASASPSASPSSSSSSSTNIISSNENDTKPPIVNEAFPDSQKQSHQEATESKIEVLLSSTSSYSNQTVKNRRITWGFIQNILLESFLRIKTWLSASVGAFWATLSLIDHFIETRLGLPLILSDRHFAPEPLNRQLAWQETPMISFHDTDSQCEIFYSLGNDEINPHYLSAVNRARKWSEEAALALNEIQASFEQKNHNQINWAGKSYCNGFSLYNYSNNNDNKQQDCNKMDCQRGRAALSADSNYSQRPVSASLLTPLALPTLQDTACSIASFPDALQIKRHATTVHDREVLANTSANSDSGRGFSWMFSGGEQQKHRAPADFQGQNARYSGLKASSQSAMPLGDLGFACERQQPKHNKHPHKQEEQQQEERQRNDRTLLEQRLGSSKAQLSMQKPTNTLGEFHVSDIPVHHIALGEDTSGSPRGPILSSEGYNQFPDPQQHRQQLATEFNHNNAQEFDHRQSDPALVLVSKSTLSNLSEQIAFSMNRMKDLEEKVRVIPELQRRLHNVMSDTSSSSLVRADSRSSSLGIRDQKYITENNNHIDHLNYSVSGHNNSGNGCANNYPRRSSLNDGHDVPYKTLFSSSLRQPYGGSMRYSPSSRANNLSTSQHSGQDLARASSFSINSPYINGQRYFDKISKSSNINNGIINVSSNNESSRKSLDILNAHRSVQESFSGSGNLGQSSTKVEYEDLINDLISLSYSVNYLSSNSNSAHSQSSSSGNNSQVAKETHGDKLEPHDASRTSKTKRFIHSKSNNNNRHFMSAQPSNFSNTYHLATSNNNSVHHHKNQHSTFNSSMNHLYSNHARDNNNSHHSTSYLSARNFNGSGSLSLQSTPVKSALDCGCQSFKEHLRYNSISREQRLNGAKSHQQVISPAPHTGVSSNNISPQPPTKQKADASTNTDLSMDDVVTKSELNKLVDNFRNTSSSNFLPQANISLELKLHDKNAARNISISPISDTSSSGSATGPNSSSQPESRSSSSADDRFDGEQDEEEEDDEISDDNVGLKTNSSASAKDISDESDLKEEEASVATTSHNEDGDEEDEDEDEEIEVNLHSIDCAEEAYSLGSSYQDPSDFEEYCAYGESLDRRTKDFLSHTTKIPNDLRFALIRLNDSIRKEKPFNQIESSSNCIDVIRKEWFDVAASKDSQAIKTKLYVDFFESFTKQLLNMVVNLTDSAGNTAMHYAASHFRLDIIEILLGTKVCDVNCRNKAGYTPIMLLALADLEEAHEREVARHLFSMGDVNIKAKTSGQTALMLAASHGRLSTCKLLLECGADPSLQDYDGSTALMCGSELGNEAVVRCLLAHRLTDPNATDNDGLDALTIAMNNGHKNIGLMLYAAKNVPRMARSSILNNNSRLVSSAGSNYLGASLRRSRGKTVLNHVRRADSLLGHGHSSSFRHLQIDDA